ncbi:MAG: phosphatase PAP2 family protein [Candidatus Nanopelagicales bacterium]
MSTTPVAATAMVPVERTVRRLGWLAGWCGALAVAAYGVLVWTSWGQRGDDEAWVSRGAIDHPDLLVDRDLLGVVTVAGLVVTLVLLAAVGLARRTPRRALVAAAGFAGAVVTAEVLRRVLPRPGLDDVWADVLGEKAFNTFPSGHATIATASALALVLVSAPAWRRWVGLAGIAWASLVGIATVASGWHRPSDALGGVLLAGLWLSGVAAWWVARAGRPGPSRRMAYGLPWGLGLVFVVAVELWWSRSGIGTGVGKAGGTEVLVYVLGQALVVLAVVVLLTTYGPLMHHVVLEPEDGDGRPG